MTWETPRTVWVTNEAVGPSDFNRIEGNTGLLRDVQSRYIWGFNTNVIAEGDSVFWISIGQCYVYDGSEYIPVEVPVSNSKTLANWAPGPGNGSKASGSGPFANGQWWYVYLIYNPVTQAYDFQIDDNPAGTNINESGYFKRIISVIQVFDTGAGVFGCYLIRSINNRFYTPRQFAQLDAPPSVPRWVFALSATGIDTHASGLVEDVSTQYRLAPSLEVEIFGRITMSMGMPSGDVVVMAYPGFGVSNRVNDLRIFNWAPGTTRIDNGAYSMLLRSDGYITVQSANYSSGGGASVGSYGVSSGTVQGFRWER